MKKIVLIILTLLSNLVFAQTWEFVGLDSMVIYNLLVKGDTIWAGTRDISVNDNSGLYYSLDSGNSWVRLDSSLGQGAIIFFTVDESNSAIIYMIKGSSQWSRDGDIFKTTNSGLTWNTLNSQLGFKVKVFILSPLDNSEYYVVINSRGHEWSITQVFYKTTNGGENWEFKCCPGDLNHGMVMSSAISKLDANTLYISGSGVGAGIFFKRSTNRGESWVSLSEPPVSRIFPDSFIQNRLYLFSYQYNSYSSDGGYSWQGMSGEFSSDAIFISFYQDIYSSLIYILMNEGLFYSANDSIYWKLIPGSDELPLVTSRYSASNINSVSIDHVNNYTYVGTSNGIYRSGLATAINESEQQLPVTNYSLAQNYPNPFNPSTIISYQIPENSFVTIKVYDAIGNEVETLVSENKHSGIYEVTFGAKRLTSGVYFYRLQAGSFVETRRMLLLK